MGFSSALQGRAAHDALIVRQEAELRLMETMKRSIQLKAKFDKEYSIGLAAVAIQGLKIDRADDLQGSLITKSWRSYMDEIDHQAKQFKANSELLEVICEKIGHLSQDKRKARKSYQEEHNRIAARLHHLTEEVVRKKSEYQKNLEGYKALRTRFEEHYIKSGRSGRKLDDVRDKYQKACRKLHLTHNEYVLSIIEAIEVEKDFRTVLLPGLLEHQQSVQESFVLLWKNILQEASQHSDLTSDKFKEIQRRIESIINNINPAEEYREFTERHKTLPATPVIFQFDESLIEDIPGKLQTNTLTVDNLTIDWLRSRLNELETTVKECQEKQDKMLCDLNGGLPPLNGSNGISKDIQRQSKDLNSIRCQEKQKQKLADVIRNALSDVGCEELPSGCDDHLTVEQNFIENSFNNDQTTIATTNSSVTTTFLQKGVDVMSLIRGPFFKRKSTINSIKTGLQTSSDHSQSLGSFSVNNSTKNILTHNSDACLNFNNESKSVVCLKDSTNIYAELNISESMCEINNTNSSYYNLTNGINKNINKFNQTGLIKTSIDVHLDKIDEINKSLDNKLLQAVDNIDEDETSTKKENPNFFANYDSEIFENSRDSKMTGDLKENHGQNLNDDLRRNYAKAINNVKENYNEEISKNLIENNDQKFTDNLMENYDEKNTGHLTENHGRNIEDNVGKNYDKIIENLNENYDEKITKDLIENNGQKFNDNFIENYNEKITGHLTETHGLNINDNVKKNCDKEINDKIKGNCDKKITEDVSENNDQKFNDNLSENHDKNINENRKENEDLIVNHVQRSNNDHKENCDKRITEHFIENYDKKITKDVKEIHTETPPVDCIENQIDIIDPTNTCKASILISDPIPIIVKTKKRSLSFTQKSFNSLLSSFKEIKLSNFTHKTNKNFDDICTISKLDPIEKTTKLEMNKFQDYKNEKKSMKNNLKSKLSFFQSNKKFRICEKCEKKQKLHPSKSVFDFAKEFNTDKFFENEFCICSDANKFFKNSTNEDNIICIKEHNYTEPVFVSFSTNRPLYEEEWFHGVLPREEVVRLLKNEGDFLVRETIRNEESQIVLSVCWNGHKHFIVQTTTDGHFRFEGPPFPSIQELIMHQYQSELPVTIKSGAFLKRPVMRERWELSNDDVVLLEKIGRGNFGDVYKAKLKSSNLDVAVKTCRMTLPDEQKRKFLQEGRILKQYDHPNIVKLIGICVQKQPIMIVMELVSGGSLLNFLRKNANSLTPRQLMGMCRDTAAGMRYLESKNCIHRDLAARNCLIDLENSVKISDFGMSREEEEYIVSDGMKQIPVKWTAPEALNFGKYTTLCDVWSYGILMWEIFSKGDTPYSGMSNSRARERIDAGYRMPAPENTPPEIYRLMLKCWAAEPESRPHFDEIHTAVDALLIRETG